MAEKILVARQFNRYLQMSVQGAALTDDRAMEVSSLYPEWAENYAYTVDEIVKYGLNAEGMPQLYRVIQAHTSQADWAPDKAASLFKPIGFTESGVAIWTQPLGAHDAYSKGDVVSHQDELWTSDIDANVWEPGVYGWTKGKA